MPSVPALLVLVLAVAGCAGHEAPLTTPPTQADDERTPRAFEWAQGAWFYLQGTEREAAAAARADRLAGQRYATVSRLFWYTDLDQAKAAARQSGKPILSLRMLGRLDQDLSCANSRFFRVALYADLELSSYLRDHVILHWSSERPVPVARVDFGDGRVLERTIAGNSAHYVLDAQGRPVDVLPGLMSPAMFRTALAPAVAVAVEVADLGPEHFGERVRVFHKGRVEAAERAWASFGSIILPPEAGTSIEAAERRAVSKAAVEMPMVRELALGGEVPLGDRLLSDASAAGWDQIVTKLPAARLDLQSRALFARLSPTDWARAGQPLPDAGVDALIASFEQIMARDSAHNEYFLHHAIDRWFLDGTAPADFLALNAKIYAELFKTPATDPWLGMATPGVFTGLPDDGVVMADAKR